MLFVLIALWLTAAMLLVWDVRRSSARWLSGVTFSGGAGALAALLDDYALPYAAGHGYAPTAELLIRNLMITASLTSYYGLPYTFLMFAVRHHPAYGWLRRARLLPLYLLLPAAACMLFVRPLYPIPYPHVALWTLPYAGFGTFLLLSKREAFPAMQRNHWFTCLAILPAVDFCTVMNYLLPSFGIYDMWRYNTWMIAFAFTVFVVALFKYGFLGIQFYIRQRRLDHTLRAITSGTAILNHAIKNDVGKMQLFCEKMRRYADTTGQSELAEDIRVVAGAAEHIREMIHRVHDQTRDLALKTARVQLSAMIEETLRGLAPRLSRIVVSTSLQTDSELVCDREQVGEALHNLVLNAAEAMPQGGTLEVKLYETKKHIVIEVRDNGPGIVKKQLKQVMDPFYTTKTGGGNNFGLGLAYCYGMMKKHGGTLELKSGPGRGTSAFMSFPRKRRVMNGTKHTGVDCRG